MKRITCCVPTLAAALTALLLAVPLAGATAGPHHHGPRRHRTERASRRGPHPKPRASLHRTEHRRQAAAGPRHSHRVYRSHRHGRREALHRHPWVRRRARFIEVYDEPYYFHAGLGLYLGGLALEFTIGDRPPEGYLFYDPYCDRVFATLGLYRRYLRRHRVQGTLTLVPVGGFCGVGYGDW